MVSFGKVSVRKRHCPPQKFGLRTVPTNTEVFLGGLSGYAGKADLSSGY